MDVCEEKGFSLTEVLVTIFMLGVLFATAIPNYQSMRARAYDSVALSDFRNTRTALLTDPPEETESLYYYYVWSNGDDTARYWYFDGSRFRFDTFRIGEELPGPLSKLRFSKGTIPRLVYRYFVPNSGLDYTYVYIDHEKSKHAYLMYRLQSQFSDVEFDQTIDKFPEDA